MAPQVMLTCFYLLTIAPQLGKVLLVVSWCTPLLKTAVNQLERNIQQALLFRWYSFWLVALLKIVGLHYRLASVSYGLWSIHCLFEQCPPIVVPCHQGQSSLGSQPGMQSHWQSTQNQDDLCLNFQGLRKMVLGVRVK